MSAPWADPRWTVHAPLTVGTTLALAALSAVLAAALRRRGDSDVAGLWSRFLGLLAIATLIGSVKHGVSDGAGEGVWRAAVLLSNTFGAFATASVQLATVQAWISSARARRVLGRLIVAQFGALVAATIAWPGFTPSLVHTVAGLGPVLVVETLATMRGASGSRDIAVGLAVNGLAGALYALRVSPAPWLNPVDLAHLLMLAGLVLLYRGACARTAWHLPGPSLLPVRRLVSAPTGGGDG